MIFRYRFFMQICFLSYCQTLCEMVQIRQQARTSGKLLKMDLLTLSTSCDLFVKHTATILSLLLVVSSFLQFLHVLQVAAFFIFLFQFDHSSEICSKFSHNSLCPFTDFKNTVCMRDMLKLHH